MLRSRKCALVALAVVAACGSDASLTADPDAGNAALDAGKPDSSSPANDASSGFDSSIAIDAGSDASDARVDAPATDAGDAATDAAVDAQPDVVVDAGPIDCTADAGAAVLRMGTGFSSVAVFSQDTKLVLPGSLAGDGNRRFWIQDPAGNGASGDKMIDMSPSGIATDRALPNTAATCTVSQVAIDSAGNGYVFDTVIDVIYRTTPSGTVSSFSTVGNVGGGGICTDSGVTGMLVRPNGTFFLGSPLNNKIYTLSANGVTRADFANVTAPGRMAHDGQDGLYVASSESMIMAVSSTGVVTTRLDATGPGVHAIRRDSNGDLYFSSMTNRLYRSANGTTTYHEVAACFVGFITDIAFDHPSNDAGAGTSLYVLTSGNNGAVHDTGDELLELKR